ncbi:MAG: hypothetical protein ACI4KM_05300, partial [Oscillospiraceae bacterium]
NAQNVTNITNSQSGTVLPANVQNIANNSADIAYTQNLTENAQNVTNVTNSGVLRGAVLPAELHSVFNHFSRNEEQFFEENYVGEQSRPRGRIIPAESDRYVISTQMVHNEAAEKASEKRRQSDSSVEFRRVSREEAIKNSYRSKLDEKTLETIDSMLATVAGAQAKSPEYKAEGEIKRMVYEYRRETLDYLSSPIPTDGAITAAAVGMLGRSNPQTMRMMLTHLKAADAVGRGISGTIVAERPINLINASDVSISHPEDNRSYLAMNSAVSFRTVDNSDSIVMLVPPVEMDRFTAESGYRQMPPIEFREKQPQPEPPKQTAKPRVLNEVMKEQSKIKAEAPRGLDSLSREDVSKLADKVYAQIESRIIRERRRMGF